MYVIKCCLAYDVHKFSSGRGQGARESEPGGAIPGSAVPKVHSVTIDLSMNCTTSYAVFRNLARREKETNAHLIQSLILWFK